MAYVPNSFSLYFKRKTLPVAHAFKKLSLSQLNAPCGCNNEVGDKFYACMQSEFAPVACKEKYLFYYSEGEVL